MYQATMGKTDVIYEQVSEKSKLQDSEITGEYEEIDASNVLTIRNDDGTETNYIPYYDNGQIVMTPITLVKEDSSVTVETVDVIYDKDEKDTIAVKEEEDTSRCRSPKYVELNGKLVKAVPIVNSDVKKSTRVAPNTYKKTLGNESLKYGRQHLVVDQKTKINPKSFKQQLLYSDDLVKKLEIAPRSRKQMRYMIEGFTQLFAYPAHPMSSKIRECHKRHCTTRKENSFENLDDMLLLPVGYQVDMDRSSLKRITRRRRCPDADAKRRRLEVAQTKESTQENQIQVLLEAANETSEHFISYYANDDDSEAGETQIVVIQEGSEDEDTKNIELLLEAVEKKEEDAEEINGDYQVFITNDNFNGSVMENQEIYIVDSGNEHFIQENNESNCTYLTIKQ